MSSNLNSESLSVAAEKSFNPVTFMEKGMFTLVHFGVSIAYTSGHSFMDDSLSKT